MAKRQYACGHLDTVICCVVLAKRDCARNYAETIKLYSQCHGYSGQEVFDDKLLSIYLSSSLHIRSNTNMQGTAGFRTAVSTIFPKDKNFTDQ